MNEGMHDLPRQKLRELIVSHGPELCDEPQRVEGLLRDHCGAHRREINVLVGALRERIPAELRNAQRAIPIEVQVARLEKRLQDNLGLTADAASWAVESWALALGVLRAPQSISRKATRPARKRSDSPTKRKPSNASPIAQKSSAVPAVTRRQPEPTKQGPTVVNRAVTPVRPAIEATVPTRRPDPPRVIPSQASAQPAAPPNSPAQSSSSGGWITLIVIAVIVWFVYTRFGDRSETRVSPGAPVDSPAPSSPSPDPDGVPPAPPIGPYTPRP